MLASVPLLPKTVEDYRPIIGDAAIDHLRSMAEPLRDARVLQLNATAFGGGVAELLASTVPIMRDLGLNADWQVMRGADEFFAVTKAIHNALQGAYVEVDPAMWDIYLRYNELNADLWDESFDFVVVHDPQPAAILATLLHRGMPMHGKWIWRCHIDLTAAQPDVWDRIRPYIEVYDAAVFSMPQYIQSNLELRNLAIVPPAIDPLSPKNYELPEETVDAITSRFGIDRTRPILTQVSRFDPWKDPLGVIDCYRIVKSEFPNVQLVLVASMAHDDPEGWSYFERTARHAGNDFNIFLLSNLNGVGNVEVNAIQRASTVVLQKSLREGFGLTVAEALWKRRPVVAGNVGGIPSQVIHGQTGFLVNSVGEAAERVIELLHNPVLREEFGRRGREHVRQNFLTTTNVARFLDLFHQLQSTPSGPSQQAVERQRTVPAGKG